MRLKINEQDVLLEGSDDTLLIDVLRNRLGLKGVRFGCGQELCGACMVLCDGEPIFSCGRPVSTVAGRHILTIEGLDDDDPLIEAFVAEQAGQCAYCLTGIIMSAKALLMRQRRPSRAQIIAALEPHLCRCGSHVRIIRAIERAAASAAGAQC